MTSAPSWENIYAAGGQLNRYPYSEVVSYVMRRWAHGVPDGFTALDVGCGSGVHANLLASLGARVTAFDFSPSAIDAARAAYPNPAITFETAGFDGFDPKGARINFVLDRLSTTHSSMVTVIRFYQNLRASLAPGAQIFWQGFHTENSGRAFGTYVAEQQHWDSFTGGVFEHLGPTVFFSDTDIARVFEGYELTAKRILSDHDVQRDYTHSYWMLELTAP